MPSGSLWLRGMVRPELQAIYMRASWGILKEETKMSQVVCWGYLENLMACLAVHGLH